MANGEEADRWEMVRCLPLQRPVRNSRHREFHVRFCPNPTQFIPYKFRQRTRCVTLHPCKGKVSQTGQMGGVAADRWPYGVAWRTSTTEVHVSEKDINHRGALFRGAVRCKREAVEGLGSGRRGQLLAPGPVRAGRRDETGERFFEGAAAATAHRRCHLCPRRREPPNHRLLGRPLEHHMRPQRGREKAQLLRRRRRGRGAACGNLRPCSAAGTSRGLATGRRGRATVSVVVVRPAIVLVGSTTIAAGRSVIARDRVAYAARDVAPPSASRHSRSRGRGLIVTDHAAAAVGARDLRELLGRSRSRHGSCEERQQCNKHLCNWLLFGTPAREPGGEPCK